MFFEKTQGTEMRRLIVLLLFLIATPAFAADPPAAPAVKGLWLLTDYPSQTVRPGEVANVRFKLQNAGLAPESLSLSVDGAPKGWKADILGGGQPVAAAMPGINESTSLQLRVDVPKDAKPGSQTLTVTAKGATQSISLPVTLTIGAETPAKLTMKSKLPSLMGTPKSTYEYTISVSNDSGKDLTVALSAQAPANFQTSFTEGYGSNEISSIPIEAGQSKDIKIKVVPPRDVKAGTYPVLVKVLSLSAKDGRLSGEATAGKPSDYTLVVGNDGTAPLEDVEVSGSVPTNWKAEYNPKSIPSVAPNEKKEVQVTVTPSDKTIAGDYVASFRANAKGESSNADFRITVTTSTVWGIVGIGIIAVALLVLLGAVARFGRR
jgi:uncharacterized membrane protein